MRICDGMGWMAAHPVLDGNGGAGVLSSGRQDNRRIGPGGDMMSRAERLDYIAEMVRELEAMAEKADCGTLAGLLGLACREARLRRGR